MSRNVYAILLVAALLLSGFAANSAFRASQPSPAAAAELSLSAGDTYRVESRPDGTVRVYVSPDVDWHDARDLQEYAVRKELEASALLGTSDEIQVQITFARPIAIEEARELVRATDLEPFHVTLEARDEDNRLRTVGSVADAALLVDVAQFTDALEEQQTRIVGVMVIDGVVPGRSLQTLIDDDRVFLLNTAPYILKQVLSVEYGVASERIQVAVKSPHWILSSTRE